MAAKFSLTFTTDLNPVLIKPRAMLSGLPRVESLLLSAPLCQHEDGVQRKTGPNKVNRGLAQLLRLNKLQALPVEPLIYRKGSGYGSPEEDGRSGGGGFDVA